MIFSNRTDWELDENDLSAAVRKARAAGREFLDLTVSNPTTCGFHYEEPSILAPLSSPAALSYSPDPFGMTSAREAVSAYYNGTIPTDRICLTTSTSEAYSFLFRLLCNRGDEVLIARPSYPLFDYIARLDDVQLREFPLFYDPHHGWAIDIHTLTQSITPRTRAIIVVHPNNPTGSFVSDTERTQLQRLCAEHNLALIVDEVFLDYALDRTHARSFTADQTPALTFVLSGLSKVCGLPQMKASWIAALGPEALVSTAMARLEVIADTFLSMNAPIQHALPNWLANRAALQQQVNTRMSENLATLDARLKSSAAERLHLQGGWTTILRVPRNLDDKPFAFAALDRNVLVQPGEFYGLAEGRIVLSLLTPTEIWSRGLAQLPL